MNMNTKRLLRGCSPHHHPHRWLFINSAILIWSFFLLLEILAITGSHDDNERTEVEFQYLLYDFGTCAIWVIEVFFNVLDHKEYLEAGEEGAGEESLLQPATERTERTRKEVTALWIEVVLAVFFFIDSTSVVYHLNRHQIHRQAEGMTFDVVLCVVAYLYMVYRQFVDWRTSGQNSGGQAEQSSSSEVQVQSDGVV